jgi:parallel beta-helix repeat protein
MRGILIVLSFALGGTAKAEAIPPLPLTHGIKITGNAVIKPGNYRVTDSKIASVQITGHDFTIDFKGAKLIGEGIHKGVGISIRNARNITIKNADVSGCLWGITVEGSVGITLADCVTSRNGDLPPGTVIDESGKEPEDQWGGGILLRDSQNCKVVRCTAQYQWDGIDVIRSENNLIEESDFSYSGNWGVHFWGSSRNIFRRNRAIWCTTGAGTLFQALTGWQTYDAQAVAIDHNSNENRIEENDLRFGGDAIFIRANEGPITPGTVVPPRNGSHRNILRNNDCSFSPNNAIEVDLVDDTVIEGNNCSYSNYGLWLGYSRRCIVRNNIAINCSTHAVEIENGQGDIFENNVFGSNRGDANHVLVYLRHNGRDKTPSGPYTFTNNLFYGSARGILLHNTAITFKNNRLDWGGALAARFVEADALSKVTDAGGNTLLSEQKTDTLPKITLPTPLVPNSWVTAKLNLPGGVVVDRTLPSIVEVQGIPAWVQKVTKNTITFKMPDDLWERPQSKAVSVRAFTGRFWSEPVEVSVAWAKQKPRIETVTPNPAHLGDTLTVTGINLQSGRLLLNGKPATLLEQSPTRLTAKLPDGILIPTRYNILFERGEGANRVHTPPTTFSIHIPTQQMPHLLSATFSPTTLKVGELLKVTFVVKNNLPAPAPLMKASQTPFTYEEKQAFWELGNSEQIGALHLRVTSNSPAGHDPGSWPWLFGFDKTSLASGDTITVEGYIRVQTAGDMEFRVGLVAGGSRFIDDNAFRTRIKVLP